MRATPQWHSFPFSISIVSRVLMSFLCNFVFVVRSMFLAWMNNSTGVRLIAFARSQKKRSYAVFDDFGQQRTKRKVHRNECSKFGRPDQMAVSFSSILHKCSLVQLVCASAPRTQHNDERNENGETNVRLVIFSHLCVFEFMHESRYSYFRAWVRILDRCSMRPQQIKNNC